MTKQDRDPVRVPGGIELPVARTTVRTSTAGRWRAGVLLFVHLLIAIHIAHWLSGAETLTPLEPSEAMQFTQRGIVNAGLIFFALTIASTAILGRWFCGWACHVVALQDATLWLLARVGIRPRPIRSRLLMSVPLLAFLYMFVSPLLYGGPRSDGLEYEFQTSEFWRTFPTWVPAILTFLTVGVLAVYLLGAKGFCTNGCPYGAAFALADRFAPYRIRVTDDCTHCGHCTSVCSSNVRVHEEVATHGMVVDPGCMKCLDCVSVCPNDALYFGAASKVTRDKTTRAPIAWGWAVLQLGFAWIALIAMLSFDRAYQVVPIDALIALGLALASTALLLATRSDSSQRWLPVDEEIAGVIGFLCGLILLRGLFGAVAFLFALGLAGVSAYAAILALRLVRARAVSLHKWVLKRNGRISGSGYIALATLTAMSVGLVSAGQARWQEVSELRRLDAVARLEQTTTPKLVALQRGTLAPQDFALLAAELAELRRLQPQVPDPLLGQALLQARQGDVPAARTTLREGVEAFPDDTRLWFNLALYEAEAGDLNAGVACLTEVVQRTPENTNALRMRINMLVALRRWSEAADDIRTVLALQGPNAELERLLAACENPPN